jgi:hypothetical protein
VTKEEMMKLTGKGKSRPESGGGPRARGLLRVAALSLGSVFVVYFVYLVVAFGSFDVRDLSYPEKVLAAYGSPENGVQTPGDAEADNADRCHESRTIAIQSHLIDFMVNENRWAPAHPLYKAGFFGLVSFDATPWFDNMAAEQQGMLDIVRRLAIEMTDSLGRIRGTSLENEQLAAAQSSLRIDETAWYVNNPFRAEVNTVSPSAAASYRKALPLYETYNNNLAGCNAVFDARADNLRGTLSRFTATLGATTSELEARSKSWAYDAKNDRIVPADGNNHGWFDFRADNHFHRARGKMYALHGVLKGMRRDFYHVLEDKNALSVWDKLESSVAEAAMVDPWITSNGAADGVLFPDHLAVMAEMVLRARTAMVEVRDIIAN